MADLNQTSRQKTSGPTLPGDAGTIGAQPETAIKVSRGKRPKTIAKNTEGNTPMPHAIIASMLMSGLAPPLTVARAKASPALSTCGAMRLISALAVSADSVSWTCSSVVASCP